MDTTRADLDRTAEVMDRITDVMDDITEVMRAKRREVVTVAPTATVTEAVARMNEHGIGSVVVTRPRERDSRSDGAQRADPPRSAHDNEELIGIFTERDVLERVIADHRDPDTTLVAEVMTRDVLTIKPSTTVSQAMRIMTRERKRHLPVSSNGFLIGLISIGDLLHWILDDREARIEDLVIYICHA